MEELTTWFEIFWQTYPADLSRKKKGSKQQALKSIEKINPDSNLRDTIITNLRELIRHDRLEEKAQGKVDRWPFVSTWLNQERWNMLEDITSYTSLNEKIAARKCRCGNEINIVNMCWSCHDEKHPPDYSLNKKAMRKNDLTKKPEESRPEYNEKCRQWLVKNGGMGKVIARGKEIHGGTQ